MQRLCALREQQAGEVGEGEEIIEYSIKAAKARAAEVRWAACRWGCFSCCPAVAVQAANFLWQYLTSPFHYFHILQESEPCLALE